MVAAVYDVFHAGQGLRPPCHPHHLRDRAFEELLTAHVQHRATQATGTVRRPAIASLPIPPDAVLVEREGVRIWVPVAMLCDKVAEPGPGTSVAFTLAATRPALSPGFLVTDASRGPDWSGPVLRLYIHLTDPDTAPRVWGEVLTHLEEARARYRAKILSSPLLYPRRDALVVYLPQAGWDVVPDLARRLGELPGIGDDTSAFTLRAGSGVALAFEPDDPNPARRGLSFGQHRASVLVAALFTVAEESTDPSATVATACLAAHIDPVAPFRNIGSPYLPAPYH